MSPGVSLHIKDFFLYIFVIVILILTGIFFLSKDNKSSSVNTTAMQDGKSSAKGKTYTSPPVLSINPKKKYSANMTTSKGEIDVELLSEETPQTVNNFIFLAKDGYYTNTIFHRVMKGFMIQGGDPNGDGTGGPGYTFADEEITRDYKRGMVAMANRGPNTNGSQFFIMHKDYNLPKQYVIFGQVLKGMDIVDAIANTEVEANSQGEVSKPKEPVSIKSIEITQQ